MVCLDVSGRRGVNAIPGGPTVHLEGVGGGDVRLVRLDRGVRGVFQAGQRRTWPAGKDKVPRLCAKGSMYLFPKHATSGSARKRRADSGTNGLKMTGSATGNGV